MAREEVDQMRAAVNDMIIKFGEYKEQFEKLSQISDAFEMECYRLGGRVEAYEQLAAKTKELIEKENWDQLKYLYAGLKL